MGEKKKRKTTRTRQGSIKLSRRTLSGNRVAGHRGADPAKIFSRRFIPTATVVDRTITPSSVHHSDNRVGGETDRSAPERQTRHSTRRSEPRRPGAPASSAGGPQGDYVARPVSQRMIHSLLSDSGSAIAAAPNRSQIPLCFAASWAARATTERGFDLLHVRARAARFVVKPRRFINNHHVHLETRRRRRGEHL